MNALKIKKKTDQFSFKYPHLRKSFQIPENIPVSKFNVFYFFVYLR